MTTHHRADHRRVARHRAAPAAARAAEDYTEYRRAGGYQPLDDAGSAARRGRPVRAARPRRRGVPAGGQGAHGARQRPSPWRCGCRRQRRGGRAGVGQGPVAAAAPAAPGARRTATGRADGRGRARLRVRLRSGRGVERRGRAGRTRRRHLGGRDVSVVTVDAGYVAGEETAAVRVVNGGPAKPTDKPPRPFEQGVAGLPTLVSNVETLANLPFLRATARPRSARTARRRRRAPSSPRHRGRARRPRCTRFRTGWRSPNCCALHGVSADHVRGVLMGGYFAGLFNRDMLDATLDHETMRRLGSGLGCGAIAILTDDCPVAVAASVMAYFDRENAGQCGSCFNGTAAMSAVTAALRDGVATDRGPGPAGAVVGGAARSRRLRDPGRRHQHRGEPAAAVPSAGRPATWKTIATHAVPARSARCGPMKWRR